MLTWSLVFPFEIKFSSHRVFTILPGVTVFGVSTSLRCVELT